MNTNDRIRAYFDKIPPCIAGQGGDVHLYKVACVLFNGWALSEEETLVWLRVFNQRCQPPWDEYRLAYKARAAANATHQNPRGHLLGGALIVKPAPMPNRKRDETPIASGKRPKTNATDTTDIPELLQYKRLLSSTVPSLIPTRKNRGLYCK